MNRPSAFFLSPEQPGPGGGGMRTASVLEYLHQKYEVDLAGFTLPVHSRATLARAGRNSLRLIRGRPPLFDRYSGFEKQVEQQMRGHYRVAVIEHFWCASYADLLRPKADLLVLDLHNIESELAKSQAIATTGLESAAFARFAVAYEKLEREWLPGFDLVLVTSEADRARVRHPNIAVYPNALPPREVAEAPEADCIVFSGNLEYHPNVVAVRWFQQEIWPKLRTDFPTLQWCLVGRNPHAVANMVAGDQRIRMTGEVGDALPLIAQAKVVVVPLRSGSGTRFKILEAWAAKRAVVSTTIGAEGLGAQDGRQIRIADDAATFQQTVDTALRSPAMRREMGDAGHALYRERFTWPVAWKALEVAGI